MTAETTSGAHAAPDSNDPFHPDDLPATTSDEAPREPVGAADGGVSDEPGDELAAEGGAAPATRKKRRRGSRGGRRRRARAGEPDAARSEASDASAGSEPDDGELADAVPAEAPEPEFVDDDEAAPAPQAATAAAPRRSRRGRRGGRDRERGAGGASGAARAPSEPARSAQDRSAPDRGATDRSAPDRSGGGRSAPALGASAGPRGAIPRELDALSDEDDAEVEAGEPALEAAGGPGGAEAAGDRKRRRRGSRGGRRRKARQGEERANGARAASADEPVEIETIPGEDDDLPVPPKAPARQPAARQPARGAASAKEEPRGRRRKKRGREEEEAEADTDAVRVVPEAERKSVILVNATDPEEQRVAVVEDGKISDFLMTVKDQDTLVNDIYRGRVVNLEPAIGAAFIDFGQGRNGFLHTSDVLSAYGEKDFSLDKLLSTQIDPEEWDENSSQPSVSAELLDPEDAKEGQEKPAKGGRSRKKAARSERRPRARPRRPITELLKKGQAVVVQVTKDAIGDKGPTLTTYISIPGRYLVLMPSMARTGVSRKIEDEKERRRLKRILQSLEVPNGMGVIVRTAGVGHSKVEIQRDLDYLTSLWEAFGKKLNHGHGPAPLYRESDVAIRTMRDLYSPQTRAVVVDDPEVQRHIVEFTEKLMPEDVERVHLHTDQKPLFQAYSLEQDFERIFQRRIELPSGGSIVFDQAEALVAIDVNSGRTRSDGFDFEDIALKTNLEAAPEIARQIRLRDLGGIIVVDFIDMMKMSNIRAVERAFKDALSTDRARSKLGRISQFGLLEMTRQRLGPGMNKKVFTTCPRCRGTGRIRTVNSRAAAILRRLSSAMTHKGFQTVEVRAHPEVVAYLKSDCYDHVRALEYRFQRDVRLVEAADQPEDSVLRYLRADGREVRPGGRRKR